MNDMRYGLFVVVLVFGIVIWPQVAQGAELEMCVKPAELPFSDYKDAIQLFEAGNLKAKQFLFSDAVREYKAALAHWKDPRIYYNLSRAYLGLERPLDAYQSIIQAVRCGPAPFADEGVKAETIYRSALEIRDRLLRESLASIVLLPKEPGITVKTDEQPMHHLKDRHQQFLLPKAHTIVVSKSGYLPGIKAVHPPRGQTIALEVTSEELLAPWLPWTLVGAGSVLEAVGLVFYVAALSNPTTNGIVCTSICPQFPSGEPTRDALLSGWSIATMVVGSATIIAGLGLLWWSPEPELQINVIDSDVTSPVSVATSIRARMTGR